METNTVTKSAIYIPHNKLILSKQNVRKAKPRKETDEELKANIRAHGVLQNLVVAAVEGTDQYEVGGGGRRWRLVGDLIKEGVFPADHELLCVEVDPDDLINASLGENHGRETTHPADQIIAVKKLSESGQSVEQIAKQLYLPDVRVKQLLRLANLAPMILNEFRAGNIGLSAAEAFAITDDTKKQVACFKALKPHVEALRVKRYLTDSFMDSDSAVPKYVGLDAYKEAGGELQSDLLGETTYIVNVELMQKLANEKLQRYLNRQSKKWKWGEIIEDQYEASKIGRIASPDFVGVPEELLAEIKNVEEEYFPLDDRYYDLEEEEESRYQELEGRLSDLQNEKRKYQAFTDEQKAMSGVAVYIGRDGKPKTIKGIVKKSDEPKVKKSEQQNGDKNEDVSEIVESAALKECLGQVYQQAFHAEALKNQNLMFDLLVYSIAVSGSNKCFFSTQIRTNLYQLNEEHLLQTNAFAALEEAKQKLALSFLDKSDETESFETFRSLSKAEKMEILSFFVALSIANPMTSGRDSIPNYLAEAIDFKIEAHWEPTAENYFSRLQKGSLLAAGLQMFGEQWVDDYRGTPKGKLVEVIAEREEAKAWIPLCFRKDRK